MAIPQLERRRAESALSRFAERVPPHLRDKLSYTYRVRGNVVTLYERRPRFDRRDEFLELGVARFRFDPESYGWTLKWADRNSRWHVYEGFEGIRDFSELVAEVERDPTGIFLG
jgi:hypothetical protein